MKDFFEQIKDVINPLKVQYLLVDIEGNGYHFHCQSSTAIDIEKEMSDPKREVVPLTVQGLLMGYLVIQERLTHRERVLLQELIEVTQDNYDKSIEQRLLYNRNNFWKNFFYQRINKEDLLQYQKKFDIAQQGKYGLVYLKLIPSASYQTCVIDQVVEIITHYLHWQRMVKHVVSLKSGEAAIIYELPEENDRQIIEQFRAFWKTEAKVVDQIKNKTAIAQHAVVIGVGSPITLFADLPLMFFQLKDFIRSAVKINTRSRVLLYEHVPLYALLQKITPKEADDFISIALKGLEESDVKLLRTLEALFDNNLNVARAAKSLGVHRNTLEYRIAQITKKTQLDPLSFFDGAQLFLALRLKDIYRK